MGKNRRPVSSPVPRKPKLISKPIVRFRPPSTQEILEVIERRQQERDRIKIPWANDAE